MNRYKLSKAGIHVNEGVQRFGGDVEYYEGLLQKFLQDKHYSLLCEAVAQKNAEAAFQAAHALKGEAGNLSLAKFYDDLFPFVEELRIGSLEHAEEYMKQVSQDYEDIREAMQ